MATVLTALIAATVAATGWFIVHQLTTRRNDRTKRLELSIAHTKSKLGNSMRRSYIFLANSTRL
jgi:hypothetical protein